MNPSTYQGFGSGVVGAGAITSFQQTGPFFSSFNFTLPVGTKRFEALLVGGGGGAASDYVDPYGNGNGYSGGGGFGGLAIFNIPIYLDEYSLLIGAGGVLGGNGGTTSLQIGSAILARVGGGGFGAVGGTNAGAGRYGGHGGGAGRFDFAWGGSQLALGGNGGEPMQGRVIFHLNQDNTPSVELWSTGANTYSANPLPHGTAFRSNTVTAGNSTGTPGYLGAGNAGTDGNQNAAFRSCGAWSNASFGGGSRATNSNFPANTRIWGFTLPTGNTNYGGAGVFALPSGANGGAGGGGGGGFTGGTGGVGAAVFRYYF